MNTARLVALLMIPVALPLLGQSTTPQPPSAPATTPATTPATQAATMPASQAALTPPVTGRAQPPAGPNLGGRGGWGGWGGGGGTGGDGGGGRDRFGRGGPYANPAATFDAVKSKISATDEEWKVIAPKLRKVIITRRDADAGLGDNANAVAVNRPFGGGRMGGDSFAGPGGEGAGAFGSRGRMRTDAPATTTAASAPATRPSTADVLVGGGTAPVGGNPGGVDRAPGFVGRPGEPGARQGMVATALADLQAAIDDKAYTPEHIADKVAALRAARTKARADLQTAVDDLLLLLTPDQEAVLVSLGYLE